MITKLVMHAFLTAFYMFRVVFMAFFGTSAAAAHGRAPGDPHGGGPAHDAPWVMTIPLWVLALLAIAVGVTLIPHPAAEFESPHWLEYGAITVALAGIGLAWLTYGAKVVDAERLAGVFGPIRAAHRLGRPLPGGRHRQPAERLGALRRRSPPPDAGRPAAGLRVRRRARRAAADDPEPVAAMSIWLAQ